MVRWKIVQGSLKMVRIALINELLQNMTVMFSKIDKVIINYLFVLIIYKKFLFILSDTMMKVDS